LNKDEGVHIVPTKSEVDQFKGQRMGMILFRNPFQFKPTSNKDAARIIRGVAKTVKDQINEQSVNKLKQSNEKGGVRLLSNTQKNTKMK
jgi:hypothetical protein